MALHKLVFDATDTESTAASANVGAYVRSSKSGALITNHSSVEDPSITFGFVDGDINAGLDTIAETAHGLNTGDVVQFSTSGTLPTGISAATDYFIIRTSANAFQIASSAYNAENGTQVDISADGSGTHTLTSQEVDRRALDVHIVSGINVEVDLDAGDDSVASWTHDGTGNAIGSTAGSLDVNLTNASVTVTATNLDIRDLVFATDKVDVSGSEVSLDAATLAALETITVNQGTSPWVIGDGGSSITVDASQLDIDDLNATDDAVAAWLSDGSGNAISSTGGSLNVNMTNSVTVSDAALADTALLATAEAVGSTIGQIVDAGDELASRKYLFLYNNGNKEVYVGQTGITSSTGFPIPPGAILEARIGAAVDVFMISQAGTQDVRSLQLS